MQPEFVSTWADEILRRSRLPPIPPQTTQLRPRTWLDKICQFHPVSPWDKSWFCREEDEIKHTLEWLYSVNPSLSWNKRLHKKSQNSPLPFLNLKFLGTQPTDFLTPTWFPQETLTSESSEKFKIFSPWLRAMFDQDLLEFHRDKIVMISDSASASVSMTVFRIERILAGSHQLHLTSRCLRRNLEENLWQDVNFPDPLKGQTPLMSQSWSMGSKKFNKYQKVSISFNPNREDQRTFKVAQASYAGWQHWPCGHLAWGAFGSADFVHQISRLQSGTGRSSHPGTNWARIPELINLAWRCRNFVETLQKQHETDWKFVKLFGFWQFYLVLVIVRTCKSQYSALRMAYTPLEAAQVIMQALCRKLSSRKNGPWESLGDKAHTHKSATINNHCVPVSSCIILYHLVSSCVILYHLVSSCIILYPFPWASMQFHLIWRMKIRILRI